MKKFTFKLTPDGESQDIYTGIEEISEGWLMTTCGDPITAEEADEHTAAIADAFISGDPSAIDRLVNIWDENIIDDRCLDYVNDVLIVWGLR